MSRDKPEFIRTEAWTGYRFCGGPALGWETVLRIGNRVLLPEAACFACSFSPESPVKLSELRINQLRDAVRANSVSFPSQVPAFERHDRPD